MPPPIIPNIIKVNKISKNANKSELNLGTNKARFLGFKGYRHSCYANIVISYRTWTQIIKNQTNFTKRVVPVGSDFSFPKGKIKVAMQIFKVFDKIMSVKIIEI